MSVKTGKKQDTKFKSGRSGNPKGRPQGSRNRATLVLESIMDKEAEAITRKVIETAKEGDLVAARIILDRVVAPRKDRLVSLALPAIKKPEDVVQVMAKITNAVAEGSITPTEAQALSATIEGYRKVLETVELEKRIAELEKSKR